MVKLRLTRAGAKGAPYYHIVAADSRARRDGSYLEKLGAYDPMKKPHEVTFNKERVDYWLGTGAQPTETVASLLKRGESEPQS